ncbi:MAG TPA: response regulator [Candidatus Limnocylindria bacterium]|nr:response regulator [Candidatus Limnocylindria bacterium]
MNRRGVVLYVDDCESVSWLVKRFFEKRYPGYEIVTASSAEQAWDELEARHGGAEFPNAVITDIQLGGAADGFALVEKIRAEFPQTRAIVVSATLSHQDRERSYGAGAHAVAEKTLSIDRFITLLYDLVQCPADVIPVQFRAA